MCASNRGRFIALGIVLLLFPASLLAQQGYVNTSSVSGAPGSTVNIPLTAVLNSNVSIDSLAFGLSVTSTGTAPAFSQQLAFTPASSSISVSLTAYAPGQIGPFLRMS